MRRGAIAHTPPDDHLTLVQDDAEELYETAPCAYLSVTLDGLITRVNGTFLDWTGFDRCDLVARRRWQDLLAAGDRIFYETHLAPAMVMQGGVREIAVNIVTASGDRLPVLVNAGSKVDADGIPVALRIVLIDARERRAYEEELLAARQAAEEAEERAARLAQTLQASLVPPILIEVDGLDIGAAYRPSGDGSVVGGDFYDVLELNPNSWAFVLGDVCGKGVDAAVLTAVARDTIRNKLLRSSSPEKVLGAVREVMLRYHPTEFCTAVMLVVTATPEGFQMRSASGGHPPPLRRSSDGTIEHLGAPGTILGMVPEGTVTEHRTRLHPGDLVVLYTDGVTEARRDKEFFDEERLLAVVKDTGVKSAQVIADEIVDAALAFQDGFARDDIAVLVVRVPGEPG